MPGERHRHQRFGRPGCAQTVVRRRDQVAFLLRTASRTDDPLWCHDVAIHTCAPAFAALGAIASSRARRPSAQGDCTDRHRAAMRPPPAPQALRLVNAWNTRSRGALRMRIILSSRSLACVAALVLALLPARLLLLVHVHAAYRVQYPARCSGCRHYVGGPSLTGRISMVPTRATAPRAAMVIASSRSVTSISVSPPSCSCVSANGPSVTNCLPLRTRTLVAVDGGCSGAPADTARSP